MRLSGNNVIEALAPEIPIKFIGLALQRCPIIFWFFGLRIRGKPKVRHDPVNLLAVLVQMVGRQVGVTPHHFNAFPSSQLLKFGDANARLNHPARLGVSQIVEAEILDTRPLARCNKPRAVRAVQRLAAIGEHIFSVLSHLRHDRVYRRLIQWHADCSPCLRFIRPEVARAYAKVNKMEGVEALPITGAEIKPGGSDRVQGYGLFPTAETLAAADVLRSKPLAPATEQEMLGGKPPDKLRDVDLDMYAGFGTPDMQRIALREIDRRAGIEPEPEILGGMKPAELRDVDLDMYAGFGTPEMQQIALREIDRRAALSREDAPVGLPAESTPIRNPSMADAVARQLTLDRSAGSGARNAGAAFYSPESNDSGYTFRPLTREMNDAGQEVYRDVRDVGSTAPSPEQLRASVASALGENAVSRLIIHADDAAAAEHMSRRQSGFDTAAARGAEGFMAPDGSMHLIAANLSSPARGTWVAWHEGSHEAIDAEVARRAGATPAEVRQARNSDKPAGQALRNQYDEMMTVAERSPAIKRIADAIQAERVRDEAPIDRRSAVEEAIVELAAASKAGEWSGVRARYGLSAKEIPQGLLNVSRTLFERAGDILVNTVRKVMGKTQPVTEDAAVSIIKNLRHFEGDMPPPAPALGDLYAQAADAWGREQAALGPRPLPTDNVNDIPRGYADAGMGAEASGGYGRFSRNADEQNIPDGRTLTDGRASAEIDIKPPPVNRDELHRAASVFLSAFDEGTHRYLPDSPFLKVVRRTSDAATNELRGSAETGRMVEKPLAGFSGFRTVGEIVPGDSFHPDGMLLVKVYGKEQLQRGLDQEPALTFVVAHDGNLTVNGPDPNGATFREFQKLGWATHAKGAEGEVQHGWTALADPNRKTGKLPVSQVMQLLADVHARTREWRFADHVGLYWDRATGATGNMDGTGRSGAMYFSRPKDKALRGEERFAPDREETVAALKWLESGDPVAAMRGDEVPRMKFGELQRWMAEYWARHGGNTVERDDLGAITIDKRSVATTLAHGATQAKIQALYLAPQALRDGVLLGELPQEVNKPRAFVIAAPIQIGDAAYKMMMMVRRDVNMQRLYVHEVVLRSGEGPHDAFKSAAASQEGAELHAASRGTLHQFMRDLQDPQGSGEGKASYSRPASPKDIDRAMQEGGQHLADAIGKIGGRNPIGLAEHAWQTRADARRWIAENRSGLWEKILTGVFDESLPLSRVSLEGHMQSRVAKGGAEGAMETTLMHGPVYMTDDGVLQPIRGGDGKGFIKHLAEKLGTEKDVNDFFNWMTGMRAKELMKPTAEFPHGRENLFTPEQVDALINLRNGTMADGRPRAAAFSAMMPVYDAYRDAALAVAEKAGLLSAQTRADYMNYPYLPFYRVIEDEAAHGRPSQGLTNQNVIRQLKGGTENLGNPLENILMNWNALLVASQRNNAARTVLEAAEKQGIAKRTNSQEGDVWVKENGVKTYYEVSDKPVLAALHSVSNSVVTGNPAIDAAIKGMSLFKRIFTQGVMASPTTRIRNVVRDLFQSVATSDLNVSDYSKGFALLSAKGEEFWQAKAGGALFSTGSLAEGRGSTEVIKDLQRHGIHGKITPIHDAWEMYRKAGEYGESLSKASLFAKKMQEGSGALEAAYQARDLMDFNARGNWAVIRTLAAITPFFNARLQGLYKLGRTAADPTERVKMAAVTGTLAMASALLYLVNKDEEWFKKLDDSTRNNYWVTPIPGTDRVALIPKPFEIGALATVIERGTELLLGGNDYKAKDFAKTVGHVLVDQLSLISVPQAVKPIYEASKNHDSFTDRPIDTPAEMRRLPETRYTEKTPAIAVAAGKATGLSPNQIEHMVKGYFGWVGVQAMHWADAMTRPLTNMPDKPAVPADEYFFGGFQRQQDQFSSKYITRLYETQKKLDKVYATSRWMAENRDPDLREFKSEHKAELRLRNMYDNEVQSEGQINSRIRAIAGSRTIPPEEKRQRIDVLRERKSQLAERLDERVRATEN